MAKKPKRVENDNSERYLVPYADLLTLMLAFFVVLYAMSEVDEEKMQQVGDSFASAFNVSVNESPVGFEKQIHIRETRQPASDAQIKEMQAISEQNSLRELQREINEKISEQGLESQVSTNLDSMGLRIILTNEILFETASAELSNEKKQKIN